MRLENCIRRWLGLKAHRVGQVREEDGELIAEIQHVATVLIFKRDLGSMFDYLGSSH